MFDQDVALRSRHVSPIRDHTSLRVVFVQPVDDVSTVCAPRRRHHQGDRLVSLAEAARGDSVLVVELKQRHVANAVSRLPIRPTTLLPSASPERAHEKLTALIETVHLAVVDHGFVIVEVPELRTRLHCTSAGGIQRHHVDQRQDHGQPQAEMHGFEDAVISTTNSPGVELLKARSEEVAGLAIWSVPTHFTHDISKQLPGWSGALWRLGGVLADVLDDRPEIQHRPPIHIPQVRKQQVRVMTANERVVPRHPQEPGARLLAFLHPSRRRPKARPQIVWKTIAARRALAPTSRASMHTEFRWPSEMQIVARTGLHQGRQQLAHRCQVHGASSIARRKDLVQDSTQTRPLRLHEIDVMGSDIRIPHEALRALVAVARIPLRHQVLEVIPESRFLSPFVDRFGCA